MSVKKIVIIENEKIFEENNNFYCDNIDAKSIPEGINKFKKTYVIARKSKINRVQKINLNEIKTGSNIFSFIYLLLKTFNQKNINYLLVSINPYTFFSSIILLLFKKNIFIYLRSSGHDEYKSKYGIFGKLIYHIMFLLTTPWSNLIVCSRRFTKKKNYHLVFPSQLEKKWFENLKEVSVDKIKLLYVGRMRVEKGIFDFIKMFNKLNLNAELSIASDIKNKQLLYPTLNNKINLLGYVSDPQTLINIYDNHNIMILPSFTEAYPYVVDESLSRNRPVIIFEDIEYIIKDKRGIFVSKRNLDSFSKTVKYIMQNYYEIQKDIEKNSLPTKQSMLKQISDILG